MIFFMQAPVMDSDIQWHLMKFAKESEIKDWEGSFRWEHTSDGKYALKT